MMVRAETSVIGVWSAGSVAPPRLASTGVDVVLLEKDTFRRDKTCRAGVSTESLKVLANTGLGEWASGFQANDCLRLSAPDGRILGFVRRR